jgi:AraC-like DNA-binding protein
VPVSKRSVQAILDALARLGVSAAQLGASRVEDDEGLAEVWRKAIAHTGRRTVPLELGLAMPLGAMGVVDYLAAASATVGAAVTVAQQVFPLVAPAVQLSLERLRSGARSVVIVNHPPFVGQSESDLLVLGVLVGRLRQLASRPLALPVVDLTEPERARGRWLELLGVPRVRLGARRTALQLSAADWAVPLRSADPRLLEMLRAAVGAEQRTVDALMVAVRALANERLPGSLTLEDAASSLGLSRRSLQRRLAASTMTLSRMNDDVRRARAEQLVAEGWLTLGEVASKVGFAEQASFTRAWRRWHGAPPSRRRR